MSHKAKELVYLEKKSLSFESKETTHQFEEHIALYGQLFPATVYQKDGIFKVVDGNKRCETLCSEEKEVECRVIEVNSEEEAIIEEIRLNSERGLTLLEKALLTKRLLHSGINKEEVIEKHLRILQLPPKQLVLENLLLVAGLPKEHSLFFNGRNFGEYLLQLIFNLDDDNREAFLNCVVDFKVNHNQGKEILENLILTNKPFSDLLKPYQEKLMHEPEKSSYWLNLLRKSLQKDDTETTAKLNEIKKLLKGNIQISEGDYLKNGAVKLEVNLKKEGDIKTAMKVLENLKTKMFNG